MSDFSEIFETVFASFDEFHDALLPLVNVALVAAIILSVYRSKSLSGLLLPFFTLLAILIYGDLMGLVNKISTDFSLTINPDGPDLLANFYAEYIEELEQETGGSKLERLRKGVAGIVFEIQFFFAAVLGTILLIISYLIKGVAIFFHEGYLMFSPLLLSMFLFEKTRSISINFLFGHTSVLLWPIGWAVLAVFIKALLEGVQISFAPSLSLILTASAFSVLWGIGFVVMPFVISKVILSGGNAVSASFAAIVGTPVAVAGQAAIVAGGASAALGAFNSGGGGMIGGASGNEGISAGQFHAQMMRTESQNSSMAVGSSITPSQGGDSSGGNASGGSSVAGGVVSETASGGGESNLVAGAGGSAGGEQHTGSGAHSGGSSGAGEQEQSSSPKVESMMEMRRRQNHGNIPIPEPLYPDPRNKA